MRPTIAAAPNLLRHKSLLYCRRSILSTWMEECQEAISILIFIITNNINIVFNITCICIVIVAGLFGDKTEEDICFVCFAPTSSISVADAATF